MVTKDEKKELISEIIAYWSNDWNKFVRDALCARLDRDQQAIIESVQHNPMTAVASGLLVEKILLLPVLRYVLCI